MINDIHIYDDIISIDKQKQLEKYFLGDSANWKFGNNTEYLDTYFPQGVIKSTDSITDSIRNIIIEIENNVMMNMKSEVLVNYRYKINLLKVSDYSESRNLDDAIHIDRNQKHISMVYYVNNTDGDTKFYNILDGDINKTIDYISKKEYNRFSEFKSVSPKMGRVVVFNGLIPHRSSYPTITDRCVINFNTVIKSEPKSLF